LQLLQKTHSTQRIPQIGIHRPVAQLAERWSPKPKVSGSSPDGPAKNCIGGNMDTIQPGIYNHFKGGKYLVTGVATHSETQEQLVIYRPLYGEFTLMVRPLTMFTEQVDKEGYKGPRFTFVRSA
jgi:hypothetical protein